MTKQSDPRFYAPQGICPMYEGVKVKDCKGKNRAKEDCQYKVADQDKCNLSKEGPK